ncbi:MAG: MFS transporter [Alicyclobacillus sp.]|nr:MFS transporter [Alicyclobacillus sp.]
MTCFTLAEFVRGSFFLAYFPFYAAQHLGWSVAWIGAVTTAHYLSETACKTVAGAALDRFTIRRVVTGGALLAAVGLLGAIRIGDPRWAVAGAAVWGAGISPLWLAVLGGRRAQDPGQGTWMSRNYTLWLVAAGAGPVLVSPLLPHWSDHLGWLLASLWLLACLAAAGAPQRTLSGRRRTDAWGRQLQRFLRERSSLMSGVMVQTAAASMLVPTLPLFVSEQLGVPEQWYGLVVVAAGAVAIPVLLAAGRLVDTSGPRRFVVAGFALSGAGVASLPTWPGANWLWIGLCGFCLAIGFGLVMPAWNAYVTRAIPDDWRASAWGVYTTVEGLGASVGPLVGGVVAHAFGLAAPFWASAVCLLALAAHYGAAFWRRA